jgi:hypothetical protein
VSDAYQWFTLVIEQTHLAIRVLIMEFELICQLPEIKDNDYPSYSKDDYYFSASGEDLLALETGLLTWEIPSASWKYTGNNNYHGLSEAPWPDGTSYFGYLALGIDNVGRFTSDDTTVSTATTNTDGRTHIKLHPRNPLCPKKGEVRFGDSDIHAWNDSWSQSVYYNYTRQIHKWATYNQTSNGFGPNTSMYTGGSPSPIDNLKNVRKLLDSSGNEVDGGWGNLLRTTQGIKIENRYSSLRSNSILWKAYSPNYFVSQNENFHIKYSSQIEGVGGSSYNGYKHIFSFCMGNVVNALDTSHSGFASFGIAIRGYHQDEDDNFLPSTDWGGLYLHHDNNGSYSNTGNDTYIAMKVGADNLGNLMETWDHNNNASKWPSGGHPNENLGCIFNIDMTYNSSENKITFDFEFLEANSCLYGERNPDGSTVVFYEGDNTINFNFGNTFSSNYSNSTGPNDRSGKFQYFLVGNKPKMLFTNNDNYYTKQCVKNMAFVSGF